jgi:serine/threonine protein kinase
MSDADPGLITLFAEALERTDPAELASYLDEASQGDAALRERVEALLAAHDGAGRFLQADATGAIGEGLNATHQMTGVHAAEGSPPSQFATEALRGDGGDLTIAYASPDGRTGFTSGQVIGGRYTLLEILGEGGMGTVYKAEQSQPVKRQVALKLIKVGMDSRTVLARFDAERQALAMMDHPNIARVYDGGATEAHQPYFVMEFVQGVAITEYCDQHRLSVDARLQLFVAVCQAVQHAHQKGIIHRDIKPSNVMVTEVDGRPTPKVIDFGVAKATESRLTDQTLGDTGAIVGTPTYMSPEQADPSSMDIDTRTDVYALGVILYELLAGSTPLDATQFKRGALLEMLRMVREVDPSKPSTKVSTADALPSIAAHRGISPEQLKRELRGDLDWIVMKALEKDRTRRYETANGFAADILRHLASEPVLAAPPSRSYRLRKFVRKHRVGVTAASLVLLALVAGIAGTTLGLFEARRQEKEARRQENLANERAEGERLATKKALAAAEEEKKAKETVEVVLGFVESKVFAAARPKGRAEGLGYNVTLIDAVTAALPSIGKDFADRPLTEARLRMTIGISFTSLGKEEIGSGQFEAARSLYSRNLGPDHRDTLRSMDLLAAAYSGLGRHADALKLKKEMLALQKAKLGPDNSNTLMSMGRLATSYSNVGLHADALKLNEETLALQKAKLGPDHPYTLLSMSNLADNYSNVGRHADALKLNEETLAFRKAKFGPNHPDTLKSMLSLAWSYYILGRHADALKLNEETLALQKAKLGPDHPDTLRSMHNLAIIYHGLGRHADALKLNEESWALQKAMLGPDHPNTLWSMHNLANSYSVLGRHADALKLNEEILALRKGKLGPDHLDTHASMKTLADSFGTLGRNAEALKLNEETLAWRRAKLGPNHPETLASMGSLATSYLATGRTPEALELMQKCAIANPKDSVLMLRVAALQAWFGKAQEFAVTRRGILEVALGTNDEYLASLASKLSSILPSSDTEELDAAIVLGRMAAKRGDVKKGNLEWFLHSLGMAEYRGGDNAACEATLLAAEEAGKNNACVKGISAFYRAMSLHQRGRVDEARKLAIETAAKMKPLPADEQNPLGVDAYHDDLILWLAYKEAKALIGFDAPPAIQPKPEEK